ncbi:MAG: hypothetical protein H0T90_00640 [Gemmatimonadales bacterium]|nr:hypothetical protein [Gemmatimonadales bacterium]
MTLGGLLIWWGLDKFYQVEHGVQVAQHFYGGVGTGVTVIIWAASLVLWAFRDEDRLALDRRRDAARRP